MNLATKFWPFCGLVTLLGGCQNPVVQGVPAKAQAQESSEHAGDERKLAALFPGAKLDQKPLVLGRESGAALQEATGLRLAGGESEWEAFEAIKNGRGVGWALLCHAELPIGEMHVGLTVDRDFKITHVVAMEAVNAEFRCFVAQFRGKDFRQLFCIGRDLKLIEGYPLQFSQAVADTTRRALFLLQHSFDSLQITPTPPTPVRRFP